MTDSVPEMARLTLEFDPRDAPELLEALGSATLRYGYQIVDHHNVDQLSEAPELAVPGPPEFNQARITIVPIDGQPVAVVTETKLREFADEQHNPRAANSRVSRIINAIGWHGHLSQIRPFIEPQSYGFGRDSRELIGIRAEQMVPFTTALHDREIKLNNVAAGSIDLLGDYCQVLYASAAIRRRRYIRRLGRAAHQSRTQNS